MGKRGRLPEYDQVMQVRVTDSQFEFLGELADLHGTSRSAIVRGLIDIAFADALKQEVRDAGQSS